ncbi:MAG TPA: multidrug ABC transporter ATPase [Microbacterium sp.]|nr:multidrug ABC transporter ATPase [Microbacterium sp.]
MMSNNDDGAPVVRRIDKILAFTSLGLLLISVICFFATMIIGKGVWPAVIVVQAYGPIVAFLLLLVLLVMSFARRGRADKR